MVDQKKDNKNFKTVLCPETFDYFGAPRALYFGKIPTLWKIQVKSITKLTVAVEPPTTQSQQQTTF